MTWLLAIWQVTVCLTCSSSFPPVIDEEDPTITAGSIVTVTVQLKRQNMAVLLNLEGKTEKSEKPEEIAAENVEEEEEEEKPPTEEQVGPPSLLSPSLQK